MSIRNVTEYQAIDVKEAGTVIHLIYVGNAQKAKKIDMMIDIMILLEDTFTLDLYLVSHNDTVSL